MEPLWENLELKPFRGKIPKIKIASVCPSNTDLLAHLGILNTCVARDDWSDWPRSAVGSIPVIGSVLNIDIEALQRTQPDLILASLNVPGMERTIGKLEATGIPMVIYDPETWEDVLGNLQDLGDRLDIGDHASEVVACASKKVSDLENISQRLDPMSVLVEWWPKPVIVPFKETYVNDVLNWVGCFNPFADRPGRSGRVSLDEIGKANPDLYTVSWCGTPWDDYQIKSVKDRFAHDPDLNFMQEKARIFRLWEGEIGHPSLRLLCAAEKILKSRLELQL